MKSTKFNTDIRYKGKFCITSVSFVSFVFWSHKDQEKRLNSFTKFIFQIFFLWDKGLTLKWDLWGEGLGQEGAGSTYWIVVQFYLIYSVSCTYVLILWSRRPSWKRCCLNWDMGRAKEAVTWGSERKGSKLGSQWGRELGKFKEMNEINESRNEAKSYPLEVAMRVITYYRTRSFPVFISGLSPKATPRG